MSKSGTTTEYSRGVGCTVLLERRLETNELFVRRGINQSHPSYDRNFALEVEDSFYWIVLGYGLLCGEIGVWSGVPWKLTERKQGVNPQKLRCGEGAWKHRRHGRRKPRRHWNCSGLQPCPQLQNQRSRSSSWL